MVMRYSGDGADLWLQAGPMIHALAPGSPADFFAAGETLATIPSATVARYGCYANCDDSTVQPVLNVEDFACFINEFAHAITLPYQQQIEHYANCTGGVNPPPVLNVEDFTCFMMKFAQGCP
jgi:hypothetical protein